MSKCIVTAFEPFNNRKMNVSNEVLKNLKLDVKKVFIPVSWEKSYQKIIESLNDDIDYLVLCGEAGERKNITIELVAINLMDAIIPDNDGIIKRNEKIDDGNDAYFSNVDVLDLVDKLNQKDIKVNVSLSAGSYLCNYVYYKALRKIMNSNYHTKVVFVHFPVVDIEKNKELVTGIFPEVLKKIIENMEE